MAKKKKDVKTESTFRQPIVTVMGHVDHGKTSFLDAIRGTRVQAKEEGGITQNTRVHEVVTKSGQKITFVDTPGHEAFSNMRERGARVTDIVLLVVAADDGVQPQTRESIEFANKNNVPIIVAINKIDIEGIDLMKVKTELASYKVNIEEFGGDVMCFPISAKEKKGLNDVLDGILLLSEIRELKPNPVKEGVIAEAFVLESNQNKHFGYAAMCILKSGKLDNRYVGVTSESIFKVRSYLDENMKPLQEVRESQPFVVIGLEKDLVTGDIINFVRDEREAKELQEKLKTGEISEDAELEVPADLDAKSLFAQMLVSRKEKEEGVQQKELNVILKASTQGTLEAIESQIKSLATAESKVTVLSSGTGPVTDDDIMRAKVANAIILTFQTPTSSKIMSAARRERVLIRDYEIIYHLVDEIADVLDSLDVPTDEEIEIARAKVKAIFVLSNGDVVAGSEVLSGTLKRGHQVWIERSSGGNAVEVFRGKIREVRINKDQVKEVKKGLECGILLDKVTEELQEGDEIVSYKVERSR